MKDLLYGLMLESYNDCAVVLAEYAAGSVEKFEKRVCGAECHQLPDRRHAQ